MKIFNLFIFCALLSLMCNFKAKAQSGRLKVIGYVTDSQGTPIPSASVVEENTKNGVITDIDGKFVITVDVNKTLVISSIGFSDTEITVFDEKELRIKLENDTEALDEVVVVGYGVQKKINLTGSVASVSGKVLEDRPVTNISKALQGQIANLNMKAGGGEPGSAFEYNIRGVTSLSGGKPFFIIDGVPVENINYLNPSDIESITVLKDAASASIYGARAAYGVIIVNTKSGSKNDKITVSFNSIASWNSATKIPNQVNSLQFAEAYNIAGKNSGMAPMFSDEHIERIRRYMADPVNTPSNLHNPNNPNYWSYATLDNDNVDWFRELFKPTSFNQKYDLSINGGTKKINYYIGTGYYDEGGLLRYGDEKYKRLNLTSNLHYEPQKWLSGDLRVKFYSSNKNIPTNHYNWMWGDWVTLASTRYPNWSLKDPNGHWSATSHVPRQYQGGRGITDQRTLSLTKAFEINPIKGWKINVDYNFRIDNAKTENQMKPYEWEWTVDQKPVMTNDNYFRKAMSEDFYHSFNAYTSYTNSIGKHNFHAMIGQQLEYFKYDFLEGTRLNLIALDLPSMGVATGNQTNNGMISHSANMGTFMRASYNYDERYLIEFNARYDGSSKFQKGKRFGFFPSVSAGYNIAKEKFWNVNMINILKLRASYGTLGNQDVPNYLYLSKISIGSNYPYLVDGKLPNYLTNPGLVSSDLTWETSSTIDFGVDLSMLSNRLSLSFDWYERTTKNMFGPANQLPGVLGAAIPQKNNADLSTKGFELNIGWKDKIGEFGYSANFVLSDNRSKITKYYTLTNNITHYREGYEFGEIWGFHSNGLIQTEEQLKNMPDQSWMGSNWSLGDVMYEDLNGDGKVNLGDWTVENSGDYRKIGNSSPRFNFGLSLGADWKGFDFNLFVQGVGKRDFFPGSGNHAVFFWGFIGGWGQNLYEESLDFWTPNNTGAYYPKPYLTSEVTKNQQGSTRYMQNAAYMRLKNLQLGYTLPQNLMQKIKIDKVRVFVNCENLLTITKLQRSYDPELTDWGGKIYPLMKSFSLGLNVNF